MLPYTCKYANTQGTRQLRSLINLQLQSFSFVIGCGSVIRLLIFSVVFAHFLAEIVGSNQVSVSMKLKKDFNLLQLQYVLDSEVKTLYSWGQPHRLNEAILLDCDAWFSYAHISINLMFKI